MNLAQLRTFVTVIDQGSFSRAAKVLGLSQPAITMQVQALESDVGQRLLDRRYRRVEPTEAGHVLLPYARRVLSEIEAARERLEDVSSRVTGRLAVAASTTPGQYLLPKLLGAFIRRYPDVDVTLTVHDTAEVADRVAAGEAHLGMTGARVPGSRLGFEAVSDDTIVLIAPAGTGGRAGLAEAARRPWIMREHGSGTRAVVEASMREARMDPASLEVVMELGTNEAVVSAVEGGMGLGAVSRWVAAKAVELGAVDEIVTEPFPLRRPLFLVLPKGRPTKAAAALAAHLRAQHA